MEYNGRWKKADLNVKKQAIYSLVHYYKNVEALRKLEAELLHGGGTQNSGRHSTSPGDPTMVRAIRLADHRERNRLLREIQPVERLVNWVHRQEQAQDMLRLLQLRYFAEKRRGREAAAAVCGLTEWQARRLCDAMIDWLVQERERS